MKLDRCYWCEEPIMRRDLRHALMPEYHYACALRAVLGSIGHLRGQCSCYVKDATAEDDPPGLSRRQAARLVADYVRQQDANPAQGRN